MNVISWIFGIVFLLIGVLNMFWGNDPGYGIFVFVLSFVFFPPVNSLFAEKTGYKIHWILKVLLGLFIIWSALGVGELFSKIELMRKSF